MLTEKDNKCPGGSTEFIEFQQFAIQMASPYIETHFPIDQLKH
jgi:hypothetical protein